MFAIIDSYRDTPADFAADPAKATSSNVSEIIIPNFNENTYTLVMPMLAYLSNQTSSRWLTWVGAQSPSKIIAKEYQFNDKNVRLIRSEHDQKTLSIMTNMLRAGTSAFVVGNVSDQFSISIDERLSLESACCFGNSKAVLVKSDLVYH